MKEKKSRRKKPNKQQREERRAREAAIFNEGFIMGYSIGKAQGIKEGKELAQREYGRLP